MICTNCRTAADAGREGIAAHFNAGCPAIEVTTNSEEANDVDGEGFMYIVDTARCDCQHRDDLPKRELKASEV